MDDILGAIVGLFVCFGLPVATLGGLIYLLTRRGDGAAAEARADRLEHELGGVRRDLDVLRTEHTKLREAHDGLAVHVAVLTSRARTGAVAPSSSVAAATSEAPSELVREVALAEARVLEPVVARDIVPASAPNEAELASSPGVSMRAEPGAMARGPADSAPTPLAASPLAALPLAASDSAPAGAAAQAGAPAGASTPASGATPSVESAPRRSTAAIAASLGGATSSASSASSASPARPSAASPPAPPSRPPLLAPTVPEGPGLEQWIGVRGAAAAGAIVLVIAGLYFFQYSIEHGLIGPQLRVALGALVGLGCVVASDTFLRTRAPALAPWLAGAGIAILYGSAWALSALYHLAPVWVSSVLMIATTATATGLAVRRDAFPIAVLGLLGGFVTPIALSTGEDHPIPLFGYLLLLDAAILFVSHRRGWPSLGLLALLGTAIYQLSWLSLNMRDDTFAIGAGVVVAFAALFSLVPGRPAAAAEVGEEPSPLPIATRAGATLLPFLFVLTFAFRDGALAHGWLTVALTTLACVASVAIGRRFGHGWLPPAAAVAAAGVVAVWLVRWPLSSEHAPHLAALVLLPALVFHVHAELDRHRTLDALGAAGVASLAPMAAIALALFARPEPAVVPVLLVLVVLLALVVRASSVAPRPAFLLVAPLVAVVAFLALDVAAAREGGVPSPSFLLALLSLPALALSIGGLLARPEARLSLDVGALLAACLALGGLALVSQESTTDAWSFAITATVVVLLGLLSTARRAPASLGLALVVAAALAETAWAFALPPEGQPDLRLPTLTFAVLTFAAWPLFARNVGRTAGGWRAAALAAPAFFLGLRRGWIGELGTSYIGLLPVVLAVLVLAVAFAARRRTRSDAATQRVATVWLAAVAAGFVTLAIPLQLRNEWLTIGWALEGAALLALDHRLRHPGLRALALALFVAVFVRLSMNEYVLHYYARSGWRIFNWLSYTYLVPAAAMLAGSLLLARHEVESRTSVEREVMGALGERPIFSGLLAGGVVVVVFVWLNLTIFDWYASGPALSIPTERMPARDLTLSIAWALYALVLLAIGMARSSTALRVTSLLLILGTCGKVFLYDLATLEDLYRVAALVGLALSLIVVSLFYQRFVFRRDAAERARGGSV